LAERYDDAERLVQQPHAQMEADSYATGRAEDFAEPVAIVGRDPRG
jgi:hypothetical protein